MGLLEKAFHSSDNNQPSLHNAGKGLLELAEELRTQKTNDIENQNDTASEITNLCIDRLSRLADDGKHIDTALSVLKAFFSIIAAFIFVQRDNQYEISHSFGSSAFKEDVSSQLQARLVSIQGSERSNTFAATVLGLGFFPAKSTAYAYPLHCPAKDSSKSILILIAERNESIAQESLQKVINECSMKFYPKECNAQVKNGPNSPRSILSEIADACDILGGKAQTLLLDLSEITTTAAGDSVSSILSLLVGNSARALEVEPRRYLILLKKGIDRELYGHQLIKSIRTNLKLEPAQIRVVHSSDLLNAYSIQELILTLKKGI